MEKYNIGKNIKEYRTLNNLTQKELADKLGLERSNIAKFESGSKVDICYIEKMCYIFNINIEKFLLPKFTVILDTSALLNYQEILKDLIDKVNKIYICSVVIDELDNRKDKGDYKSSQIIKQINAYKKEYPEKIIIEDINRNCKNDKAIIKYANNLSKEEDNLYIISDDKTFKTRYKNTISVKEYIVKFSKEPNNYIGLINLYKELINEDITNLDKIHINKNINLNDTLPNGETLLVSIIRSNCKEKEQKIKFLIKNGVDINKTSGKYYLTPLSHCVQKNDLDSFKLLLKEKNININKGSKDDNSIRNTLDKNQGNTPLMIICWHGRIDFFYEILKYKDKLCFNKQDSNGYTALIKSVLQIDKRNKKDNFIYNNKKTIYNELIKIDEVDQKITDYNDLTAKDYIKKEGIDYDY